MKKKLKIVIIIGCFLTLINMGIAGAMSIGEPVHEEEVIGGYSTPVVLYRHADANGPYSGDIGQSISFTGSGSNVGTINTIYEWDFGDNNDNSPEYGKYVTHSYSEPGIYYASLTVTNGLGQVYKDITPVYIDRSADHLVPDGGCSYNADVDEIITFDASDSVSNGADIVEYFWDFGDGETASGEQVTHSYGNERVYIVTLDIKDSNGNSRHDVLHADIGRSYSDKNDLFYNLGSAVQEIIDYLLNNVGFTTSIFCNLLDAKIYTNYNGNEKLTEISGFNALPKEIDVNDDGDNDIKINDLKFFDQVWSTSMFDEHSRVWLQFETTLSEVIKISSDIQAEDEFTVCIQFDFDIIKNYLDLEDTITRIGYYSPAGEEMPNSISITHILRPYILFRLFGFTNIPEQGVATAVINTVSTVQQPISMPQSVSIEGGVLNTDDTQTSPSDIGDSPVSEELEGGAQSAQSQPSQPAQPVGPGEYWPEYGLRIQGSGGGSFSLIAQFLNSAGSSKTTIGIEYGSSTSTLMYKLASNGGILNHATVFQIPGNSAKFFAEREKNSDLTEISSELSFNTEIVRGIGWSDSGVYLGILGQFEVGFSNIYFDNPECTLNIGELSFSTDGSFNLNFLNGAKLYLDGSAGFTLADLSFNKKGGGFLAEIIGTLNLDIGNTVSVALAAGELEIGFNGGLTLSSDCEYVVNGIGVIVGGDFTIDSVGTVKFTWSSNTFNIDLDAGLGFEIKDLNFEVGELIATASSIEIATNGAFGIEWDTANSLVTISGGTGASLGVTDFDITYGTSLYVSIFGSFEIQAGGWVTFGPNTFKAGFEGTLVLGTGGSYVEFEINGENIKVGGQFTLTGGEGEISFTWWGDGEFFLDVSGGPELTVSDLYFEIGEFTVTGESVGIGVSGELIVSWDTVNNEVTISAGSGVSLSIEDIEINYGTSLNIKIFGSLDIQAGGSVTFGPNKFEASFSGSLNLGTGGSYVEFEINGENIKVGGLFSFTSGGGGIEFTWDNDEFSLVLSYGPELTVEDLYFKVGDLRVTAGEVSIGANGDFSIDFDTSISEITILSDSGISFGVEDLNAKIGTILEVTIVGALDVQADGYITLAPGTFEAGFTGSLDLGTGGNYCEFIINGNTVNAGGLFSLSGGFGEIGFSWANEQFSLSVSGSPSLTVTDFFFEVDISGQTFQVTADEVGLGANGDFSIDWDTSNSEITISSDLGVTFSIENLDISYGTSLDVSIVGALDVQANGYITLSPGTFEAGFSGSLDLGTNGYYCEFTINSQSIKVGGDFTLSTGNGVISFSWTSDSVSLYVSGGPSLSVDDIYFEAGDLKVTGETVGIGASGEFSVDLDTVNEEITISGGTGVSLGFTDIQVIYSTTLDIQIIGTFNLQADGWITFGSGVFEAGFSGSLNLGTSVEFNINGDSISVGGIFSLIGGDGQISFSWIDEEFGLEVSGGPQLVVTNLYFNAEIQNEDLIIEMSELKLGVNGDFTLNWDTTTNEISLSSETGLFFELDDLEFSYGSNFEISIIGKIGVEANGLVTIAPGSFEISGSVGILLSPGFGFEINGQSVSLSGRFQLIGSSGDITVTWTDDEFSAEVSGMALLTIEDLYFQIEQLKIATEYVNVGLNGLLKIIFDTNTKSFEVGSSIGFGFDDLLVYYKESNLWYQALTVTNFDISGGGYILLQSGTNPKIEADFNGQLNLANLIVTPPSSWNVDLSIGSTTLWGDATLEIEKDVNSGKFSLVATSGSINGQISNFDAYVKIGIKDLEVSFLNFQIGGDFSLILDDLNDEVEVSSQGTLILSNFIADYGSMDIVTAMDLNADGSIIVILSQNNVNIDANVDFTWDISLDSTAIGNWDVYGELVGDIDLDAQWGADTGTIDIVINDPGLLSNFGISYNDLSLTLANITLQPGTISFEWLREDSSQTGYFLIDNDFTQTISTVNLAEITWGTKSVLIGWPDIQPGDFKFAWDIPGKELTINNGISNLFPIIAYKDTSQNLEISASALNLQGDYSKTITMNWYESGGQINGVGLDTSNSYLAQFFEIGYKKGSTGNNGKKIALYGLQCDNFYFKGIGTDEFEWGGYIYIANQLTFSTLQVNDWKDFDVQWNFQGSEKWIEFDRDPAFDFTLNLGPAYLLGYKFTAEIDLLNTEYFEFKWNIGISGKISLDTNWEYFSTIELLIEHSSGKVDITATSLRAENWWVSWTAWPPSQWNIQSGGSIQWGSVVIDVYYNGEWKHIWPWL